MGSALEVNTGYVKSAPGILKIVEFFLLLVSFACVAGCCGGAHGRFSFLLFVTIFCWLCVIAIFAFFFLKLQEKLPALNWNLIHIVFCLVISVLLIVSASLVADIAPEMKRDIDNYSRWWNVSSYGYDNLVAGLVFAFLALIAFVIDGVIHLRQMQAGQQTEGGETAQ